MGNASSSSSPSSLPLSIGGKSSNNSNNNTNNNNNANNVVNNVNTTTSSQTNQPIPDSHNYSMNNKKRKLENQPMMIITKIDHVDDQYVNNFHGENSFRTTILHDDELFN